MRDPGLHSICARLPTLNHDANGEARPGIVGVVHVIAVVHVVDVDVIGVIPAVWPRFRKPKPEAAIVEARISADQNGAANVEVVFTAKVGVEALLRNSTAAPGTEAKRRL